MQTETNTEVDPRTEADARIARAFQVVVDAGDEFDDDKDAKPRRDYTPDELEELFFLLGSAMVQLRKLAGGKDAVRRFYARSREVLKARGRDDLLDALDARSELRRVDHALDDLGAPRSAPASVPVSAGQPLGVESRVRWLGDELRRAELKAKPTLDDEAVAIVKRTFGHSVDLSEGTVGHGMARLVTLELEELGELRGQLLQLAAAIREP